MDELSRGVITSAFALAVLVPIDVWVYLDARRRERNGEPVRLDVGPIRLDRPAQWLAASIVLVAVVLPAYLVARGQTN